MFKKNSYNVSCNGVAQEISRRASETLKKIPVNVESLNKLREDLRRRSIADFKPDTFHFYTDGAEEIEYYHEPVFGCSLEQITKNRKPRVPIFVQECIKYIESKEENMKTDGLYRASGNLSQVQKIRLEVDQNNLSIMKDEEDVHVLTGSLKLFFRELKEPLIPFKQLETALHATDKPSRKEKIKDFQKLVKSLPEPNYDTLKFLLQHLLKVKEYQEFNRMNISNLAIVFGPTLMWPEQESANMALELMQQNVVIECLLKEFHEIFIH